MAKDTLKAKYNFTLAQLSLLLSTLNTLITQAKTSQIAKPHDGICWNWEYLLRDARYYGTQETRWKGADLTVDLIQDLHMGWDHPLHRREHDTVYPIKHELYAPRWEGVELEARLSLMRHLRERLRDWHRHTELREMAKALRQPGGLGAAYSRTLLQALHDSLDVVEFAARANTLPSFLGICRNWSEIHFNGQPGAEDTEEWLQPYRTLELLAMYWPQSIRPGERVCSPVPRDWHFSTWSGPNLAARLSLIAFMKTRLRALARNHD